MAIKKKKNHCEDNHQSEVFKTQPYKALTTWCDSVSHPALGRR